MFDGFDNDVVITFLGWLAIMVAAVCFGITWGITGITWCGIVALIAGSITFLPFILYALIQWRIDRAKSQGKKS